MSVESIKTELTNFLNSEDEGIFAVKGKWGVGKTHLIKEVIKANKDNWKHKQHAYVSLFGINSLEDLRISIAVEMNLDNKLFNFAKSAGDFIGKIASTSDHTFGNIGSFAIRQILAQGISHSKICIDDIERRGKDLQIKDLLGFLNQLKEEKNCQIIIVFNEDELNDDKTELDKYREKVIDYEIEFVPVLLRRTLPKIVRA